jgi:hypothetical protein
MPILSSDEAAEVEAALSRHEVQGGLQALLAARLTDASEKDAGRAREAIRLALRNTSPTYNFKLLADAGARHLAREILIRELAAAIALGRAREARTRSDDPCS